MDETESDLLAGAQPEWETLQLLRNLDRELVSTTGCRRSETLDRLLVAFGEELGKVKAEEPQLTIKERQRCAKSRLAVDQWTKRTNASETFAKWKGGRTAARSGGTRSKIARVSDSVEMA
jgi:hypothetical protein